MTTIAKLIAAVAFVSALAAPASARFDGDDSALSAYSDFGSAHNVRSAQIFVNRPSR